MGVIKAWAFCAVLSVVVTGCSLFQEKKLPTTQFVYDEFEVSGRIAAKMGKEGSSARIKWSHRADIDTVDVYAPTGSIIAVILVSPREGAVLETKDQVYEAPSVEELTQRVLGWSLPLNGLKYWARGRVNPEVAVDHLAARDSQQRLTYLEQDGWKITFEQYAEGSMLPRVMRLEFEDLKIRFVLDKWIRLDL